MAKVLLLEMLLTETPQWIKSSDTIWPEIVATRDALWPEESYEGEDGCGT
jgi:hypothetical protein